MRIARTLAVLCCAALAAPTGAQAQQGWSFVVTPSLWAAGV
jgi:hypothetical protein